MRERQVGGTDGGDVSIGVQVRLQIGDRQTVAAEIQRQLAFLAGDWLAGYGDRVAVNSGGAAGWRDAAAGRYCQLFQLRSRSRIACSARTSSPAS